MSLESDGKAISNGNAKWEPHKNTLMVSFCAGAVRAVKEWALMCLMSKRSKV